MHQPESEKSSYEAQLDKQLKGIELNRLAELIAVSQSSVEQAKGRDLILIVGHTGAGKTATLNHLKHVKMEVIDGEDMAISQIRIAPGETPLGVIGEEGEEDESKTLHPLVVPVTGHPEIAYCDCPGFKETRQGEKKLCSIVGLPLAIAYARSIKAMMVVIDFAELIVTRGEAFRSLAETLEGLLEQPYSLLSRDNTDSPSQVLFVFTKVPAGKTHKTISATLKKKESFYQKKLESLSDEITKITEEITELVGVTPPNVQNHAVSEEALAAFQEQVAKRLSELSNQTQQTVKAKQARCCSLLSEHHRLARQLTLCETMLTNPDNLFIIHCTEHDDKRRLLERIGRVKDNKPIAKEQFMTGRLKENWDLLRKIMDKIATEGNELLYQLTNLPKELASLKKYRELLSQRQEAQTAMEQTLTGVTLSEEELEVIKKKLFELDEVLLTFTGKTLEARQKEIEALEEELKEIDTEEPTRYLHPSLGPVDLSFSAYYSGSATATVLLGIFLIALPSFFLSTPISISMLVYAFNPIIINNSSLHFRVANYLLAKSHQFCYKSHAFEESKLKISDGSHTWDYSFDYRDKDNPHWSEWKKRPFYYESQSFIQDKEQGVFEVTARHDWLTMESERMIEDQKATFWIELFLKKQRHPDFASRISELRSRIQVLKALGHQYRVIGNEALEARIKKEETRLTEALSLPSLQETLLEILGARINQGLAQQIVLQGYVRGLQAEYPKLIERLPQQALRYRMLTSLAAVVKTNDYVQKFIKEYEYVYLTVSAPRGLRYEKVPGDGHCLFHAVGLYVGQDQQTLRNLVAARLRSTDSELLPLLPLREGQNIEEYLQNLQDGKEWADQIEINVLMRLLDRPIIVLGLDGRIINRDQYQGTGDPIFVCYNGHNHYDALLLEPGFEHRGREILDQLTQLNEHSQKYSIPSTPKTPWHSPLTVWGRKHSPDVQPDYQAIKAKVTGDVPGAVFIPVDKPKSVGWLGKMGYKFFTSGQSVGVPENSMARRSSAMNSMREKMAMDFYARLSRYSYLIPKTRLAELPIRNKFTRRHSLTKTIYQEINRDRLSKVEEGVYVLSKYMPDYQDLSSLANCLLGTTSLSFAECIAQSCLPEKVKFDDVIIPIKGLIEIFAIGRLLADTDVLGGKAANIGFVLERNSFNAPVALRAVKVDGGYAFNFNGEQNLVYRSAHPDEESTNPLKDDPRHLQYSNGDGIIKWQNLSPSQQKTFVAALSFGIAQLTEKASSGFFENRASIKEFQKTPKGQSLPSVEDCLRGMNAYIERQADIYAKELQSDLESSSINQKMR